MQFKYDELISSFAFSFNWRPYTEEDTTDETATTGVTVSTGRGCNTRPLFSST